MRWFKRMSFHCENSRHVYSMFNMFWANWSYLFSLQFAIILFVLKLNCLNLNAYVHKNYVIFRDIFLSFFRIEIRIATKNDHNWWIAMSLWFYLNQSNWSKQICANFFLSVGRPQKSEKYENLFWFNLDIIKAHIVNPIMFSWQTNNHFVTFVFMTISIFFYLLNIFARQPRY